MPVDQPTMAHRHASAADGSSPRLDSRSSSPAPVGNGYLPRRAVAADAPLAKEASHDHESEMQGLLTSSADAQQPFDGVEMPVGSGAHRRRQGTGWRRRLPGLPAFGDGINAGLVAVTLGAPRQAIWKMAPCHS